MFFIATAVLLVRVAGRVSPRRATHFLSLRRKKVSKERATLPPVTPTLRAGATCDARSRGVLRNSLRACGAPFGQPQQVRPQRRVSCGTRPPRALRFSARAEGLGRFRAIAALGPACATHSTCALRGRAQRWPVFFHPFWLRLRGALAGWAMRVGARMLGQLTRRICPNGAPQARSELCGAPRKRPAAGVPRSEAKGSQTVGRLSFGYFSLAKQRKVPRPPGRDPASHPQHNTHQQAANATRTTAAASTPKNARKAARVSLRPNPSVPSVMKRRPGGTKARTVSGTART